MKCQLCNRQKAFLIAKVGKAKLKVCVFCAITEKLELEGAINDQKTCMEARDKD